MAATTAGSSLGRRCSMFLELQQLLGLLQAGEPCDVNRCAASRNSRLSKIACVLYMNRAH
jgi:hypothetical protein